MFRQKINMTLRYQQCFTWNAFYVLKQAIWFHFHQAWESRVIYCKRLSGCCRWPLGLVSKASASLRKQRAPFRAVRQPPIDTRGPADCFKVASGKLSLGFFLTESYSLGGGTFHLQISLSNGSYAHDLWPSAFFMHPRSPATQMSHGNLMKVACFVTPRKGEREPYGEKGVLQTALKYVCYHCSLAILTIDSHRSKFLRTEQTTTKAVLPKENGKLWLSDRCHFQQWIRPKASA